MSLTRRVAHNTIIQIAGKVVGGALGIAALAVTTRYLGPERFGYYATILAFLQIFSILVDFGLTLVNVQFLSRPDLQSQKVVSAMLGLRLCTAVPFLGLGIAVGFFMPYPAPIRIGIIILAFNFLAITMAQIVVGLFQRVLRMEYVAIAEVVGRVILLLGVALVSARDAGFYALLTAIVAANIVTFITLLTFSQRFGRVIPTIDITLWKRFVAASWPIGLSIACNLIYLKSNTVILSLTRPPEEVGFFGAATGAVEAVIVIPHLFAGLVLPILRSAWLTDRARFARALQKSCSAILLIAVPLVVGIITLATPLMTLFAGSAFRDAGALLSILGLAAGFVFISTLFGYIIVAIEKQRLMIWGYAATAAIALTGYLIFIPRYGAMGAAWMTVVAEGTIAAITFLASLRITRVAIAWDVAIKAIVASLVMALALRLLAPLPALVLVVVGIVTYGGTALLLKSVPRTMLQEILRQSKN